MLTLGQQLIGKNILSLRVGRPIGVVNEPIINPNNLKIEGWHATDLDSKSRMVLLSQDIREILKQGFVVNDHDALTPTDDLVRLQTVLEYNFSLIGKNIVTTSKAKLGKVSDYAFEKNGFFIQKLYVSQSILKSFTGGGLVIDRTQIVEITHKKITVDEATVKDVATAPAAA
jgi:sporulation protein YlmC with PRC-barrel domain